MTVTRGLVDVSSVIWTCLKAGKDKEYGRECPIEGTEKKQWVNSAGYGYENALNHILSALEVLKLVPRQLIFVVEGANSKIDRQSIHPGYKAGRDKVPEEYVEFNKAKQMLLDTFLALGAQAVTNNNVEADDVIGYLAKHLKGETWIITNDKDLAQCVGGNVHLLRQQKFDPNPFGDFPHKYVPVYIALVGDQNDKIPGAKGFGDMAWQSLYGVFGDEGLEALEGLIKRKELERLGEDVAELKALQLLIDQRQMVYNSYEMGRLRVEKVNTVVRPLQWTVGMAKLRDQIEDNRLKKWGGQVTLISVENYKDAFDFFSKHVKFSPEVTLDVETSTPPESDAWLEAKGKGEDKSPVDVFGSKLTGMGITFGNNMQYTFYLTVDHVPEPKVTNLSVDDVRALLEQIPRGKFIEVHNAAFELPVCYMAWGEKWAHDPLYHGFLPNVIDTRIMSSYADENRRQGLKSLSSEILKYQQETYDEVTTLVMGEEEWKARIDAGEPGRKVGEVDVLETMTKLVKIQYKMNELTARHVLSYGADDPICTSALSNHFKVVMETEDTWDVFMAVEQFPAYVTAKGFLDGADFSREEMRAMEKEDDIAYDEAWAVLRDYLIHIGFDGVNPPAYESITAAAVKEACEIVLGEKLETRMRTPSKMAKLIRQTWEDHPEIGDKAALLATMIEDDIVANFNQMVARNFDGEPKIDLDSPKQMTRLLYDRMGLPVHIINDVTTKEKEEQPELANAIARYKKKRAGHDAIVTDEDMALIRKKAKADDTAIDYALAFDEAYVTEDVRKALKAIGTMKRVATRRKLYYKNYWVMPHWKDGKIHAQLNQCAAVTRRYSSSDPNLQQLPKKGEGVRFRGCFKPHRKGAVVCSIDFAGQELRIAAERSQDRNMLACYIGDKTKDIHSITAAGAMKLKWGVAAVKELFQSYGEGIEAGADAEYELFIRLRHLDKEDPVKKQADDLRKDSKNVNFAAQFGGKAVKLSETLIMRVEDAQVFLDARDAMFPDVEQAAIRAEDLCRKYGYAKTMMGARRHLREAIASDDRWEASRAARQAWNMEVQGSAAEMAKLAMGRLWKSGALHRFDVRFIAPIHDELVTSVAAEHALEFIKIKHECMTGQYVNMGDPSDPKSVPILGSISIGPDFANQIECGDWYIPENIQAALDKIFKREHA